MKMDTEPLKSVLAAFERASFETSYDCYDAVLSTVSGTARPAGRVVKIRIFDDRGFLFFSNRESRASRHIMEIPHAALCFFWPWVHEQMRVQGRIEIVSDDVSDAAFAALTRGRQLTAWASLQSHPLSSREELMERYHETDQRYLNRDVPRPPHWGGYRLVPDRIEFWKQGDDDLHDRTLWRRIPTGWNSELLFP